MTTLIESCRIAPPPGAVADLALPLTFLDMIWLPFHPIRRLLFYELSCSRPYFLDTLVPKLKESLSLTLKHFFPLAGVLVFPLNPEKKPMIRYLVGDSVLFSIFESSDDFDSLVGDHPRDADQFYDFIPHLPQIIEDSDQKLLQVLAVQVTLFPGRGVCIGFSNHHSVGDASSIVGFIRSWASINKLGGDPESLPVFERSLVKYPLELDTVYWNQMKEAPLNSSSFPLPTNRVRATYVFTQSKIKKLKDLLHNNIPGLVHVSSFVVTAAYVWTCLAKSQTPGVHDKVVDDDELEQFLFAVDCRGRIDPPVPVNYFGNCVSYGAAKIRHGELVGESGLFVAAQAIAEEIKNRVNNKEKIMEGAENWVSEIEALRRGSFLAVSGSARVDLYSADFGWGNAKKLETLSIDGESYAMSLCKSRDFEGGLEVGLSLPKLKMDTFAALFSDGIKSS